MARVFEQAIEDVAVASGLDWDFVVDMYPRIAKKYGHWEVTVNGEFYCSADTEAEAVEELKELYKES